MSYASSSALRKRMAAPIGMRNNGIQPTKFLANFWELPTSPEQFCPNSKLHFFEPNISPYQDIEEILRLFKATWYEMQQCRLYLGVFDPISGTCYLGKGWHEPICLDREWCSCGKDGEDDQVIWRKL